MVGIASRLSRMRVSRYVRGNQADVGHGEEILKNLFRTGKTHLEKAHSWADKPMKTGGGNIRKTSTRGFPGTPETRFFLKRRISRVHREWHM